MISLSLQPQRRSWAKYWAVAQVSFLSKIAYAGDLLGRSIFFVIIIFVFVQLWRTLLGGGGMAQMDGFGPTEMVWYLVATEIMTLSRPPFQTQVDEEVKSGSLAYVLNKPYHYVSFHFASYWGDLLARFVVNLAVGAVMATMMAGPAPTTVPGFLAFLVVTAGGMSLQFLICMTIALGAFWIEDTQPFFWIYTKLVFTAGGLFVPLEIYPKTLRAIAEALPFKLFVYAPARLLVRFELPLLWRTLIGQLAWGAALALIVNILYQKGVKRLHVNGG